MRAAKYLYFFLLSLIYVPIVYGITFTPGIDFQGVGGGNVTFNQNFWAYNVDVGRPVRFTRFTWNGVNYGLMALDIQANANMTVTAVTENTVTYDVAPAGGGPIQSRIYFGGRTPTDVNGEDAFNHNPATGTTLITTTGASTVTLHYHEISTNLIETGVTLSEVFTLVALCSIFGVMEGARSGNSKLIVYLGALSLLMAFAAMIARWGY